MTIGIDIGGTNIKSVSLRDGGIISSHSVPTPEGPESIAMTVAKIIESTEVSDSPVGIACAGEISPDGVVSADNLGFDHVDLAGLIRRHTDRRFVICQDAHAASVAELTLGSMKGARNAVYLCVGTGLGGDVIIGGKSMRGVNPSSCEIGHMITHMCGKRCSCGNHGCFEAYASASALSGMTNGKFTAGEIAKRAKDGEAEFPTVWKSYIDELCCGIMNCLILYAPEVVCIGGGLSLSGEFLIRSVKDGLEKYKYYRDYFGKVGIVTARFTSDAGAVGAGLIAGETMSR